MVDGILYIGTGKWMFQFHDPRSRFDERVIDIVEASEEVDNGRVVDWRILNARAVDLLEETFLPHGARKHRPIMINRYDVLNTDADKLATLFENELSHLHSPSIDLGEALQQGRMRPSYGVERSDKTVIKTRNSTAEDYIFVEEGMVIAMDAQIADALLELGFNILIHSEKKNKIPIIGGWCVDVEAEYRMGCSTVNGIKSTPDGRELPQGVHAHDICWWTEEHALREVYHHIDAFDPSAEDLDDGVLSLMDGSSYSKARRGVSALKWLGMPEGEIEQHVRASQQAAWPRYYDSAQESARLLLNRIIEHQLGEKEALGWVVESWKREFKRLCERVEGLDRLVDHEIDMSSLIEIAELIKEFEDA
tara:strand:- start:2229 stop:3320 length:1092 start_codon:yes stop_codon:yes gene_type:complete